MGWPKLQQPRATPSRQRRRKRKLELGCTRRERQAVALGPQWTEGPEDGGGADARDTANHTEHRLVSEDVLAHGNEYRGSYTWKSIGRVQAVTERTESLHKEDEGASHGDVLRFEGSLDRVDGLLDSTSQGQAVYDLVPDPVRMACIHGECGKQTDPDRWTPGS
jgi:hypothetical protein